MLARPILAVVATLAVLPAPSRAETCRFDGVSSYNGHIAAQTEVTESGSDISVDVILRFTASTWLYDVQYFTEEISTWRGGVLQTLAANYRTVVNGRIRRQQWDVWSPAAGGGLQARRVQATRPDDFRDRHPRFTRHWPLDSFGQPWLADYAAAAPDRRPDLDIPARGMVPALRPALAMAFYWSRYLRPEGGTQPVFLPGFKRDARVDLTVSAITNAPASPRWTIPLHHPALQSGLATALVSPDGYLREIGADIRSGLGSGVGMVHADGCQGVQIRPER